MVNTRAEEQYLQKVYHALKKAEGQLTETLAKGQSTGILALQEMAGDVRLNFDNFADNLDTFAQLEMKNREIDQPVSYTHLTLPTN